MQIPRKAESFSSLSLMFRRDVHLQDAITNQLTPVTNSSVTHSRMNCFFLVNERTFIKSTKLEQVRWHKWWHLSERKNICLFLSLRKTHRLQCFIVITCWFKSFQEYIWRMSILQSLQCCDCAPQQCDHTKKRKGFGKSEKHPRRKECPLSDGEKMLQKSLARLDKIITCRVAREKGYHVMWRDHRGWEGASWTCDLWQLPVLTACVQMLLVKCHHKDVKAWGN